MEKWCVELSGDETFLEEISKATNQLLFQVISKDGRFCMESERFNELDDHKKVRELAQTFVNRLIGVGRLSGILKGGISIGTIVKDQDGCKSYFLSLQDTAYVNEGVDLTQHDPSGDLVFRSRVIADSLEDLINTSDVDNDLDKILQFLRNENWTFASMYKIIEQLIRFYGNERKFLKQDFVTKSMFKLFMRTACHPDASGIDARHATSNELPPEDPMSLNEAKEFVLHCVSHWLESKGLRLP